MPEESWAWEELMQKAWAQGYQLGMFQGGTISIVIALFPDLEELARSTIINVKDLERLQQLRVDLSISRSQEEMERVLLSLGGSDAAQL